MFFSACSYENDGHQEVDRLNSVSYAQRYRNLDSSRIYAQSALQKAKKNRYDEGRAEAALNLAFYDLARLDYNHADSLISFADSLTDDNITRLIVEIQRMRLCQRRSQNKEFYLHKTSADNILSKLKADLHTFTTWQRQKYTYAVSEYGIVLSTYLYYVNLMEESAQALLAIKSEADISLLNDTAQYLGYLYNIGAGGILLHGDKDQLFLREFQSLMQCYMLSRHTGFRFWEANSLQSISEHIAEPYGLRLVKENSPESLRYLNDDNVPDSFLAGYLAERSLQIFLDYGDIYQIAGAWRTLSQCYHRIGDYESQLSCLTNAVEDTMIFQAPDLLASIYEKFSIAYSALNDKPASDYYRNLYLDIQYYTRQDRQLEARAETLANTVSKMQLLLSLVVFVLVALVIISILLIYYRNHRDYSSQINKLKTRILDWKNRKDMELSAIREDKEQLEEQQQILRLQQDNALRTNIEQHAKVAYTQSILPLIDRMLHSVSAPPEKIKLDNIQYVYDICTSIIEYNNNFTTWVQLKRGQVSLNIEKFPLDELFDIMRLNEKSFAMAGISLVVEYSDIFVKADKVLTLFIINTIADNARKHTPSGGTVIISAKESQENEGYAEIRISDTGAGMDTEQCNQLFSYKPILNGKENLNEQRSHGFGLINCRGIMDKYKKTSTLFSKCSIKAKSEKGRGTCITFTLPMIIKTLILSLIFLLPFFVPSYASETMSLIYENKLNAYADSVYECNVRGDYSEAISFADSCFRVINENYRTLYPSNPDDTLSLLSDETEIRWQEKAVVADYDIIIFLRNEIAVASLALHAWDLYENNNNIYTKLYKLCSRDTTLNTYCITMEKTEKTSNIYVIILCILFCLLAIFFWMFYLKDTIKHRKSHANLCNIVRMLNEESKENVVLELLTDKRISGYSKEMQPIAIDIRDNVCNVIHDKTSLIDTIEIEKDELSRLKRECDRIYISNSIIDNMLSTLKHETMYYPSRICFLIKEYMTEFSSVDRSKSATSDVTARRNEKIREIFEIISYYRNLYAMLSTQVKSIETKGVTINRIKLKNLRFDFESYWKEVPENSLYILANQSLMNFLCFIIKKRNANATPIVKSVSVSDNYITINVLCKNIIMTNSHISKLFSLSSNDFDFLIIRQILREIGTSSNHFATGIIVRNTEKTNTDMLSLFITLPTI